MKKLQEHQQQTKKSLGHSSTSSFHKNAKIKDNQRTTKTHLTPTKQRKTRSNSKMHQNASKCHVTPSLHQHFLQNPPIVVASATEARILPLLPARGRPSRFGEGALFVSSRGATRRWTREKSGHRRNAAAATPALLSDSWQRMDTSKKRHDQVVGI